MSSAPGQTVGGVQSEPVTEEAREFLAEVETMDLSPIKDKTFMVGVSTGNPGKVKFLCQTVHGPFNFSEMCQEVGDMWVTHQHHAKVIILNKDMKEIVKCLDENTVDYIECHYNDIIMEEALSSFEEKEYTCVAGTVEDKTVDPSSGKILQEP